MVNHYASLMTFFYKKTGILLSLKSILHFSDKHFSRGTIYRRLKKLENGVSDALRKSLQRCLRLGVDLN